jgi:hypothetical protein
MIDNHSMTSNKQINLDSITVSSLSKNHHYNAPSYLILKQNYNQQQEKMWWKKL